MALKLYTFPGNPRANKALIAAKYNGVDITIPAGFVMGESNKTPEFLALNPLGKVPTLETPEGGIFESNAIAKYVGGLRADSQLMGASYFEAGQVNQWMDFCTTHLDLPVSNWVYQILGWMQFNKGITIKAQQDVLAALKIVDSHLEKNAFLVGSCVTLADITLVCSLDLAFRMVFDPEYRAKFPNVTRWFTTCVNQPQFVAIMGEVTLCAKMQEAKAPAKPKVEKKKKEKAPAAPKVRVLPSQSTSAHLDSPAATPAATNKPTGIGDALEKIVPLERRTICLRWLYTLLGLD
jgi:elongation factor 1-gamma